MTILREFIHAHKSNIKKKIIEKNSSFQELKGMSQVWKGTPHAHQDMKEKIHSQTHSFIAEMEI